MCVAQPESLFGPVLRSSLDEVELRRSARKLLSSFKVPTIWLLMGSDDAIPRRPTGKIAAQRLHGLLADANVEQAAPQ